MCLLASVCSAIWVVKHDGPVPWYLDEIQSLWLGSALNIFTFLILMSAIIAISLTVTMEVVKVAHAEV